MIVLWPYSYNQQSCLMSLQNNELERILPFWWLLIILFSIHLYHHRMLSELDKINSRWQTREDSALIVCYRSEVLLSQQLSWNYGFNLVSKTFLSYLFRTWSLPNANHLSTSEKILNFTVRFLWQNTYAKDTGYNQIFKSAHLLSVRSRQRVSSLTFSYKKNAYYNLCQCSIRKLCFLCGCSRTS